jgi:hypothetical protein
VKLRLVTAVRRRLDFTATSVRQLDQQLLQTRL